MRPAIGLPSNAPSLLLRPRQQLCRPDRMEVIRDHPAQGGGLSTRNTPLWAESATTELCCSSGRRKLKSSLPPGQRTHTKPVLTQKPMLTSTLLPKTQHPTVPINCADIDADPSAEDITRLLLRT